MYLDSAHQTLLEVVGDGVDPSLLTPQAFQWAFGILRSRSFPPLTGDDIALVPLADMVHHCPHLIATPPLPTVHCTLTCCLLSLIAGQSRSLKN